MFLAKTFSGKFFKVGISEFEIKIKFRFLYPYYYFSRTKFWGHNSAVFKCKCETMCIFKLLKKEK